MNRFHTLALQSILPAAAAWVRRRERLVLQQGAPLSDPMIEDARAMGVFQPERIRVLLTDRIELPGYTLLLRASRRRPRLTPPTIGGITFRYAITIRTDSADPRHVLAHECVHTAQYERLGGIRPFLFQYFQECLEFGYAQAPLELEAVQRARNIHSL